ncbi:MAG: tetratricopeptide repeat protein [Deltaproteobacteria bacterium]|nr:tetratricopeptide repeat protein [Deltaproteobacteria bacterium]
MRFLIRKIGLYIRLFRIHLVSFVFPALEETRYSKLGKTYFDLEMFKKAIPAFEKSEESHDHLDLSFSRYNWYHLGFCYLNLGDFKNAAKYFEKYLKLRRDDTVVLGLTGWCYGLLDEFELALEHYGKALKLEPDLFPLHLEYSTILSLLNRKEEALRQLREAELHIENPVEKEFIDALALKICGDLSGAIEKIKEVVTKSDGGLYHTDLLPDVDPVIALAKLQREIGDSEECLSTLEYAYKEHPNDFFLGNELAFEYAEQNINLDRGLKLAEQAINCQPDNSLFLDTKGWVLFKMGRKEDAVVHIQRALSLNPQHTQVNKHLQTIKESS